MTVVVHGTNGITTPAVDALDLELNNINVVERGSNANGEFVRFADGTQICTFVSTTFAASISTGTINGFFFADVIQPFPATFAADPAISGVVRFNGHVTPMAGHDASSTQWIMFALSGTNVGALANGQLRLMAIGHWF